MHRPGRSFYSGLLEALVEVMGTSNDYLFQHGPRAALLARRIAGEMGLHRVERARVFFGAVLMDLGMIGLAEDAWENPVPVLSRSVRSSVEDHPLRSADTVAAIPYLESVAPLVRTHHEWWDGSGYPRGLEGADIPVGARILRLADTVCALATERPYRPARKPLEIVREVRRAAGAEFSPPVTRAFLEAAPDFELRSFDRRRFRRALSDAAADLFPSSIPAVSTDQLLDIFGSLIDAKDPYTGGHSRRVAALAEAVSEKLGLTARVQRLARAAGHVHDLGKVSVPLRILTKMECLQPEERRELEAHPVTGARILSSIPSLQHLTPACRYHHERWDGHGYPEGISKHRIPLVAQILSVCDAYDAMTSGRAYRRSRSHGHAMEEIDRASGSQFGPRPAGAFLTLPFDVFRRVERYGRTASHESGLPAPSLRDLPSRRRRERTIS